MAASPHCIPSPDGKLIATLFPSVVNVRQVETFDVVNVIALPTDLVGPVLAFEWSPSSTRVLVAVADQVHVFAALPGERHHAAVRNPMPPAARPTFIGFGSSDADVCVCSSFGLKLALYDLATPPAAPRAVEISSPKFFGPTTACRGFSFRPGTRHLALLTRTAGRDMISIHHPATREVQRSWSPDATDAQGLRWSPDGRWLVAWESPSQGHRVLFFTPDGHPFRTWAGPREGAAATAATSPAGGTAAAAARDGGADPTLGAGVKLVEFSPDGRRLAVADSSRRLCIFDLASVSEAMRLQHPATVVPRDATTQVRKYVPPKSFPRVIAIGSTTHPPTHTRTNTQTYIHTDRQTDTHAYNRASRHTRFGRSRSLRLFQALSSTPSSEPPRLSTRRVEHRRKSPIPGRAVPSLPSTPHPPC